MIVENNDQLRAWLREHGYEALAGLPSFDVPQEEYDKHLADIRAQALHADEGSNQARAVYRCLTSHLGAPEKRPAAQDSMAAHLDRAARVFNQSVAVLAGKTDAHERAIKKAVDEILEDSLCRHENISGRLRELANRTEEQFHLQRSGIETLLAVHRATQEMIQGQAKRFKIALAIVLFLLAALLFLAVPRAHGQDKPNVETRNAKIETRAPAASLTVPDSYKLRIRDVQWEQDKLLIRIQNLQMQIEQAKTEIDVKSRTIQQILAQLELENHIDPAKWKFDLDLLVWLPKEK